MLRGTFFNVYLINQTSILYLEDTRLAHRREQFPVPTTQKGGQRRTKENKLPVTHQTQSQFSWHAIKNGKTKHCAIQLNQHGRRRRQPRQRAPREGRPGPTDHQAAAATQRQPPAPRRRPAETETSRERRPTRECWRDWPANEDR